MSLVWGHATGIIILLMMMIFIGIWVWAWLPRHRTEFNLLAHLPMEDQADSHQLDDKSAVRKNPYEEVL